MAVVPSLTIRHPVRAAAALGEDGRALVTCHGGRTAEDVVGALGLAMADLYPRTDGAVGATRPVRYGIGGRAPARSAGRGASLSALAAAFEAEGQRWFAEADVASAGIIKSLVPQARGEGWLQAATRSRAHSTPMETPHVERSSPMG